MAIHYSDWVAASTKHGRYRLRLTVNQGAVNVGANTSPITWALAIYSEGTYFDGRVQTGYANINGVRVWNTPDSYVSSLNAWKSLGSGSMTVAHDANGSKSIALRVSYAAGSGGFGPRVMDINTSQTLTTIPRYPTINSYTLTDVGYDRVKINFTASTALSRAQYRINGAGSWINATNGGIITGLTPNTSYSIQLWVEAANSKLGTYSSAIAIKTKPLATVGTVTSSAVGYDRFTVNFTTNGHYAERSLNGEAWTAIGTGSVITGRTPGSTNTVRVRVRPSDYESWTYSNTMSVTTLSLPSILSLSTSETFYNSFRVHFSTAGSVGFRERSLNGGTWTALTTGAYMTGLTPGTNNTIRVRVRPSNFATWTYSSTISVNTTALPKVTSISTSGEQADRFTLSFATSGNVGYRQKKLNTGAWVAATNGEVITGLAPGSRNTIQVRVRPADYDVWSYSTEIGVPTSGLSTATIKGGDIHQPFVVNIARSNANFTHTVRLYAMNDQNVYRLITTKPGITTNVNISLTEAEKNSIFTNRFNSSSTTFRVEVESFWSGSQGTTTSAAATMSFSQVNPTIGAISYEDTNTTAKALTTDNQKIVQSKSDFAAKVSGFTGLKGATIQSVVVRVATITRQYSYNLATVPAAVYNIGKLDIDANTSLTITATDSRGFSSSKTMAVVIVPYSRPHFVSYEANRLNGYEDDTTLSYKIELSKSVEATYTTSVRSKQLPDGAWTSYVATTPQNVKANNGHRFEANLTARNIGAFANVEKFIVEVKVTDHFGTYLQEMSLDAGSGLLVIDREGWAFQERVKGVSSSQHPSHIATIKDIEDARPLGPGITGPAGPMGIRGIKGDTGAKGADGAPGAKGDPFVYSDFTPQQLEALRGPEGDGNSTITSADEPILKIGAHWHKII